MQNFDSVCDRSKTKERKILACRMITISENATLKKNSISIEIIPCHDCDQQECQDIISMRTLFVIWSINMISVNVMVLQMEEYYTSHK